MSLRTGTPFRARRVIPDEGRTGRPGVAAQVRAAAQADPPFNHRRLDALRSGATVRRAAQTRLTHERGLYRCRGTLLRTTAAPTPRPESRGPRRRPPVQRRCAGPFPKMGCSGPTRDAISRSGASLTGGPAPLGTARGRADARGSPGQGPAEARFAVPPAERSRAAPPGVHRVELKYGYRPWPRSTSPWIPNSRVTARGTRPVTHRSRFLPVPA